MKGLLFAFAIALAVACGQSSDDNPLEKLSRDLASNPNSSLTHFQMGMIFVQRQDYESAAWEFEAALRGDLQPPWVQAEADQQLVQIFGLVWTRAENRRAQRASVVTDAEIVQKNEPAYSEEARIAGLEGRVELFGVVGEDGLMREPRVVRPLGLGLDEKAVDAVKQWRFRPRRDTSRPIAEARLVWVDFRLPEKQSRWHLINVEFHPSTGITRPLFAKVSYPLGTGISVSAIDEGRIIGAVGRQATATLSFDIDERGTPVRFDVRNASLELWGNEAIALVREWQFRPGMKNGIPVAVPATVELAWGPRDLSPAAIANLRAPNPQTSAQQSDLGRPVVLSSVPAEYPEEARKAGVRGTVVVSCTVDKVGLPTDLHIAKSLDSNLDQKAIDAVARYRFQPTLVNGEAVAVPTSVEVTFGPRAVKRAPGPQ